MKLIIDSRENSSLTECIEIEALGLKIDTQKEWLEIGDYVFDDVCFEAKSSFDFLQSVINKRIWSQIDNMDRAFENNNVIIYGSLDKAIKEYRKRVTKVSLRGEGIFGRPSFLHNKFMGAIGKIILDTDCNVILVDNEKMAAKVICAVCKMKPIDRSVYQPRIIKQKKISTADLRIDVLMTIKGISETKAQMLIDEFGSIMEIGESTIKEISMIDGFGSTLARRVIDTLNSEEKQVI